MTLRSRSTFRLLATFAFCIPLTACDNKKMMMAPAGNALPPGAGQLANATEEKPGNTENFQHTVENAFVSAALEPRSTFSASVDTASYSLIRAKIHDGQLPPKDAVRIADLLNYFNYDYPRPQGDEPIAAALELAPCPWNSNHHLLRIALAAKVLSIDEMPARNFVFLIDTSGSMGQDNKLPLVKRSLLLLADTLTHRDRISIVTYAGDASLRLDSTAGDQVGRIRSVINSLDARGSTNGGGGIEMAYRQAAKSFVEGGVNRVILASDGDFNVGVASEGELIRLVEEKRKTGVYLTVLGFGMGNLQDAKLEQISHHGNGHYAYIDTIDEARKLFVEQGGALAVVAKDVKLQVEFNHNRVQAYRLIGYENRILKNEDFRNDAKDAGDMGSGHTVTALYEIVPPGVDIKLPDSGDLKYQGKKPDTDAAKTGEWLTFRIRYKHPETDDAREIAFPLVKDALRKSGSVDFRFAASVAAFGLLLRDSQYKGNATWANAQSWTAEAVRGNQGGPRRDFQDLLNRAADLSKQRD